MSPDVTTGEGRVLAAGYLSTSDVALYRPSGNVLITHISMVNGHTAAVSVNLKIGTIRLAPKDLDLGIGYMAEDDRVLGLSPGQEIHGDATVDGVVSYLISGIIQT